MLSAWLRIKFPHLCDGALAASAPIAQFTSPCNAFGRIVTSGETGFFVISSVPYPFGLPRCCTMQVHVKALVC
jgi:hypothetical protein